MGVLQCLIGHPKGVPLARIAEKLDLRRARRTGSLSRSSKKGSCGSTRPRATTCSRCGS
ncbi:hypothetical protein [Amycolatopsis sp. NPDC051372]|uniref:hypothetical protein n=1 Tax=Amycolatopsis sp. NPDC051372 TaxID=3155669 RepID=UPI003417837D